MYFSREINFVINVSVWVYLIYFNWIKVTLPAERRTMAIGGDSSLAAERRLGMLNNNPVIHHGMWGVGRLCWSRGEAPRSRFQPWGMARLKNGHIPPSLRFTENVVSKREQHPKVVLLLLLWQCVTSIRIHSIFAARVPSCASGMRL